MTMYARAVWLEDEKEMEGTIPDIWIDIVQKTVRSPKKKVKQCFHNHVVPEDDWETFTLVKRKFVAGNLLYFDKMKLHGDLFNFLICELCFILIKQSVLKSIKCKFLCRECS